MREAVERLWPEIQWISSAKLREQVTQVGILNPRPGELRSHARRRQLCLRARSRL